MRTIVTLFCVVFGLVLVGWVGLQIKPAAFPAFGRQSGKLELVPVPAGLPAPVERFYRQVYGENLPVIESAVITGRVTLRIRGITFPGRLRFTHVAGQNYRHYIEATLFGLPIMKVNEHLLQGKSRLELPFGVFEGDQVDQGANLGLWGESMEFLPSILITDPRVRWEAVDDETVIMIVPYQEEEQRFVVRFDPQTGLLRIMGSMRYRDAVGGEKILWLNEALDWGAINGHKLPTVGAVTWFDEGTPWAVFTSEEVVYNVDVEDYIQQKGP